MTKRLQILQQANLIDEAYILLYYWVNKDDMEESFQRNSDLYEGDLDQYQERYDILHAIYCDMKEHFSHQKERIEYLFKSRNVDFSTYAALSLLWNFYEYNNQLKPYNEVFGNIEEENKVRAYARLIDCDDSSITSYEKLKSQADLIAFLEDSSYDKEARWEAIKIYNNQESYYNEVLTILTETVGLFQTRHQTSIATLEKTFYDYWNKYQSKNDIIDTLQEKSGLSWASDATETIVLPHLFQPFSVALSIDEENPSKPGIIRIGIMMDDKFILTDRRIKKEDIVNIGKLLSDKSKVDILEYVSKKPCYGKELANELQLSTPTISYHVNALLKERLLKAEVSANKVYYSLNRESLSAYLDNVKNYFL